MAIVQKIIDLTQFQKIGGKVPAGATVNLNEKKELVITYEEGETPCTVSLGKNTIINIPSDSSFVFSGLKIQVKPELPDNTVVFKSKYGEPVILKV